ETVAGMNRIHAGDFGGADNGGNIEVTACALRRTDADGAIGKAHVGAVTIGFGIDGDRLDSEFLASAYHANGDLAAVGDQDSLKPHGWQTEPPRTPRAVRSSPACFPRCRWFRLRFRSSASSIR